MKKKRMYHALFIIVFFLELYVESNRKVYIDDTPRLEFSKIRANRTVKLLDYFIMD